MACESVSRSPFGFQRHDSSRFCKGICPFFTMGACGGKPAEGQVKQPSKGSAMPKKEIKEGGIGHAQFIIENTGKITDYYQMDKKKLGEGSYGSVTKATNISTKAIRAVKTISKSQMKNLERFKQEIAIMKMMDHPNIIKLFESFEDHRNIYLVMELCSGGELFDRIIESGHFSEVQAAILMQQIIRAIYYMHENHVCHRDLKPENFLFMTKDPIEKNFLKIIDFGLSCKFTPGKPLSTKAGTPYYVAPQVLAGNYDQLSDLWSCGVIMYVLLCGYPPFFGDTDSEVLAKARIGVETLLDRRARVESKVCRDEKDNYDVIQAAVFKEGRGGSNDIITFLCSRGANIDSENANGYSCLHLAFQTGNMATIRAVRHARKMRRMRSLDDADENCEPEEGEVDFDAKEHKATPLELGIQWGKMNKEALAKAAPPHISSLKVFIHRAPECIPMFMSRLRDTRRMGCRNEELSKRLADKLTHKDIARLLRDYPEAAVALLNGVTAKPIVTSEGWHPLPSRVSFAARSPIVRLLKNFFPTRRFLCFYETEYSWSFDDQAYEAPAWHTKITDVKEPPRVDASIQVCYIPNIVSANIFAALVSCTGGEDPALFLYDSVAVRAAVSYTFWNGAIWVDVLQFLISFWGLTLLVLETCFKHEAAVGRETHYLDWQMNEGVFQPSFVAQSHRNGVVADWIIAKGMVDLLLEVAQFCGCLMIGEVSSYLNLGNVWDLSRSIVPIMLLFFHDSRLLHLLIVLIYWMRLLEGVTYSEKIGHALLPLQKLATGLLPAMTFTLVGFCALTHAMYAVQVEANHLWPDTLFDTFTTLITQGLPEKPPDDILELLVLYGGVLFFSVFVLNIFIGVIGEQYSKEKDQVGLMFVSVRVCGLSY
eukprot:s4334_g4.t1